jgi:hypothetical protein
MARDKLLMVKDKALLERSRTYISAVDLNKALVALLVV